MDFTFTYLKKLYKTLHSQGFLFSTVTEYCRREQPKAPFIMLRHDVEARYGHALRFAEMQHQLGIRGTYYFRIFPKAGNEEIIRKIAALGHEIGYHYDDLSACKGNYEKAMQRFQKNLAFLRSIATVETIAMEGAPFSKYDNRLLWGKSMEYGVGSREKGVRSREYGVGSREIPPSSSKGSGKQQSAGEGIKDGSLFSRREGLRRTREGGPPSSSEDSGKQQSAGEGIKDGSLFSRREGLRRTRVEKVSSEEPEKLTAHRSSLIAGQSYRDFGILCEPYFDIDFNEVFYLTDTGRRWDGKFAVRDRVGSKEYGVGSKERGEKKWPVYKTTNDIIRAVEAGTFPRQAMMTFHPQRWHSRPLLWVKELVWQNVKNQGKRVLVAMGR